MAALYYADHCDKIKAVVDIFDSSESAHIPKAKTALQSNNNLASLAFSKLHFQYRSVAISRLESASLPQKDTIGVMETVQNSTKEIPEYLRTACANKLLNYLKRNPGCEKIKTVNAIIRENEFTGEFTCNDILHCRIKKFFSSYKNV